ncbi:MAG TPA: MBL fold metallo-hydrolase [Anaerolineae bacterium]|nr:MBL fold metallo-hydrolase [Anaerolineae bacterium]
MTVTLTYHGHACFSLFGGGYTIWLDPYLTDNPQADIELPEITQADYILVSHGHRDHLGDAISIAGQGPPSSPTTRLPCTAKDRVSRLTGSTSEVATSSPLAWSR